MSLRELWTDKLEASWHRRGNLVGDHDVARHDLSAVVIASPAPDGEACGLTSTGLQWIYGGPD